MGLMGVMGAAAEVAGCGERSPCHGLWQGDGLYIKILEAFSVDGRTLFHCFDNYSHEFLIFYRASVCTAIESIPVSGD